MTAIAGYGVPRKQLRAAIVVCLCLMFAGVLVLLAGGCAVRNLPGGGTAPATRFEQVLTWNAAIAQANDGFADNVIALQRSGILEMDYAKAVLLKQAAIADADQKITQQIQAAALCASQAAGANATAAQLDTAGVACSQATSSAIGSEVQLITSSIADLNNGMLLGVKDPAKQQALTAILTTIGQLVANISSALTQGGVIH